MLMSLANGIYILECTDQYRVKEASSIENIYCSFIAKQGGGEIVSTRAVEMFMDIKHTKYLDKALRIATKMLKNITCEYGINILTVPLTWNELCKDAYYLAQKEIPALMSRNYDGRYSRQIELLQKYIRKRENFLGKES